MFLTLLGFAGVATIKKNIDLFIGVLSTCLGLIGLNLKILNTTIIITKSSRFI
jgi:uncharacterized membrane protein YbaN (DUF454 family)